MLTSAPINRDLGLLIMRIACGGMMALFHGWPKLQSFFDRMDSFPDPLHLSSPVSLTLTVLAEFVCGMLICLGVFTRISGILMAITMCVAAFIVHAGDPIADRELALFYLAGSMLIVLNGSGKYSLNRISFK